MLNYNVKRRYLYDKADYTSMREHLHLRWAEKLHDFTTNEQWEIFVKELNLALDYYVPQTMNNYQGKLFIDKN